MCVHPLRLILDICFQSRCTLMHCICASSCCFNCELSAPKAFGTMLGHLIVISLNLGFLKLYWTSEWCGELYVRRFYSLDAAWDPSLFLTGSLGFLMLRTQVMLWESSKALSHEQSLWSGARVQQDTSSPASLDWPDTLGATHYPSGVNAPS